MKTLLFLVFMIAACIAPTHLEAYGCNVCHSKKPKMVKMHEELGFRDCFKCHGQGMEKTPERQKAQMIDDARCTSCHKK